MYDNSPTDSITKLDVIRDLANIAANFEPIAGDVLVMIGKVVNPPKPTPAAEPSAKQPLSPTIDELVLCRSRGKVPAIKVYRARTGLGLRESKDNIEKGIDFLGWTNDIYDKPIAYTPVVEDIEPVPF